MNGEKARESFKSSQDLINRAISMAKSSLEDFNTNCAIILYILDSIYGEDWSKKDCYKHLAKDPSVLLSCTLWHKFKVEAAKPSIGQIASSTCCSIYKLLGLAVISAIPFFVTKYSRTSLALGAVAGSSAILMANIVYNICQEYCKDRSFTIDDMIEKYPETLGRPQKENLGV